MATLYKHGELGQIERVAYKVAYCADGKILRNDGDGWKQWRKCKPGVDPTQHYRDMVEKYEMKLREYPTFAEWRREFHTCVCSKLRVLALETIRMMPDDPDGCWSTFEDFYSDNNPSLDEWVTLCRLFKASEDEAKSKQPSQPVAA